MALIVDHLRRSIEELAEFFALSENRQRMSELSDTEQRVIRAGVIKSFELTYELCRKLSSRWLQSNDAIGSRTGVAPTELYRLAAAHGLIADPEIWMEYREARNSAAHEYDESKIIEIYRLIGSFIADARFLLSKLEPHDD